VDALIGRLAAAADRGEPLAALANGAAFREARRGGYRPSDVDAFLDRVAASA
jgi:DivIVA domain-containing protein